MHDRLSRTERLLLWLGALIVLFSFVYTAMGVNLQGGVVSPELERMAREYAATARQKQARAAQTTESDAFPPVFCFTGLRTATFDAQGGLREVLRAGIAQRRGKGLPVELTDFSIETFSRENRPDALGITREIRVCRVLYGAHGEYDPVTGDLKVTGKWWTHSRELGG